MELDAHRERGLSSTWYWVHPNAHCMHGIATECSNGLETVHEVKKSSCWRQLTKGDEPWIDIEPGRAGPPNP